MSSEPCLSSGTGDLPSTKLLFRVNPGLTVQDYRAGCPACQKCIRADPAVGVSGVMGGFGGAGAATIGFPAWDWLDGQEYPCQLQADFAGQERIMGRDVLNLDILFRGPAGTTWAGRTMDLDTNKIDDAGF